MTDIFKVPKPATIADIIVYLLGARMARKTKFLAWPPDAFAVAGYLLQTSGAYSEIVKICPRGSFHGERWQKRCENCGNKWRKGAVTGVFPKQVESWWKYVLGKSPTPILEIPKYRKLWQ